MVDIDLLGWMSSIPKLLDWVPRKEFKLVECDGMGKEMSSNKLNLFFIRIRARGHGMNKLTEKGNAFM